MESVLDDLKTQLGNFRPVDYELEWWEVDYIANQRAKDAIIEIHDLLVQFGLSFKAIKEVVMFVQSSPDSSAAYSLIQDIIHRLSLFCHYHRLTRWQTIDLSHAKLMRYLFKWKNEYLQEPKRNERWFMRDKWYLVVSNPENGSMINEECEASHKSYTDQTTVMKIAIERNSLIRITDLPEFLNSCEPLDRIVPNLDRVINERIAHIDECVQYSGPIRYVDQSLLKFANMMCTACSILVDQRKRESTRQFL